MIQPKMLKHKEEQLNSILWKLKEATDRQKSYADLKWTPWDLLWVKKLLLRVWPMKSAIKWTKLDPQFVDPFKIIKKNSPIAYKLALHQVCQKCIMSFMSLYWESMLLNPLMCWIFFIYKCQTLKMSKLSLI